MMHAFSPFSSAAISVAKKHGILAIRCPKEKRGKLQHLAIIQQLKSLLLSQSSSRLRNLAEQFGITTPDTFIGIADTGKMTAARYRNIFDSTGCGVKEIMTHPGYFDKHEHHDFPAGFLKNTREVELKGLIEPGLKEYGKSQDLTFIHFGEL